MKLDKNMRLTEHFRLGEFLVSREYPSLAEQLAPSPVHVNCLYLLCATVLEPMRVKFGVPFVVTSGLRSPELNRKVHGDAKSLHMYGKAADFAVTPRKQLVDIYLAIKDGLPFAWSQLILYRKDNFIHVALPHPGVEELCETRY